MPVKPNADYHRRAELRLLSIVEALTVTGPLKPLIESSAVARTEVRGKPPLRHFLMSTRRYTESSPAKPDLLRAAAESSGLIFLPIQEKGAFDVGVLARYYRAILATRPDLIETHDCKSHFLLFLIRILHPELRRCKWVAFHHGYTRTSWRIRLYQQLDRVSLRQADHVITLCAPFAHDLCSKGVKRESITVIKNFIAPRDPPTNEAKAQVRRELHIAANEHLILSVGRLSREKAHSDLLAAFREVLRRNSALRPRLVLVGDGPERPGLQRLAADLGSAVTFCGHLADPWVLMNAADLFALPSHSEGSPLVLFEAMAARLPIVATSVGGIPETVFDEVSALLVPPNSPDDLATALLRLLEDDSLRHRLRAAAAAKVASYSPIAYVTHLFGIYDSLLAR